MWTGRTALWAGAAGRSGESEDEESLTQRTKIAKKRKRGAPDNAPLFFCRAEWFALAYKSEGRTDLKAGHYKIKENAAGRARFARPALQVEETVGADY